jgi:hypothetical protein
MIRRPAASAMITAAAVAAIGAAAIWLAAIDSPAWSRPLLVIAIAALAGSLAGRWPWTGTLTAAATVALAACTAAAASGRVSVARLAGDGLLLLAYLLTLDAAETSRPSGALPMTVRGHLPAFAAGAAAAAVATLAATLPARPTPTLAAAGAAALTAAYWLVIRPAAPATAAPTRRPHG